MRRLDKHPKKLVESDRFLQIHLSWLAQAIHYSDTDLILHTCLNESIRSFEGLIMVSQLQWGP
jgi:hypothetical protein